MQTIVVVDTSICTDNLGDEIIMDAVNAVVSDLFPDAYVWRVPSHEALSERTRKWIQRASLCFIGGTNLLSSNIGLNTLWRIGPDDAKVYGTTPTICLGTGWNDYMSPPTPATRDILRSALSPQFKHAVRDTYTRGHLDTAGVPAVVTSCPTTWPLTPEHCKSIPRAKAPAAVFTLSAWRQDVAADSAFVNVLREHYDRVYFFPQMQDDWVYFNSLGWTDIKSVAPTVQGYNAFLKNEDVDFVGTRLHGGIRALQLGRRALILSIDNRAAEIGKDTGLPVLPRGTDTRSLAQWIEAGAATDIHLPHEAIESWRAQFRLESLHQKAHAESLLPEPVEPPSKVSPHRRIMRKGKRLVQELMTKTG